MYDKRYSPKEIKRERWWAGFNMFVIMALLCWGVGKVAYISGYNQGYRAGLFITPAAQQSSFIKPIPETNLNSQVINHPGCWKCQIRNYFNWLLSYWFIGALIVALWAFYKFATYLPGNNAIVTGSNNKLEQTIRHNNRRT